MAVAVQENEFKGEVGVSVIIKAIRMNGTDDDKLFRELFLWDDYLAKKDRDYTPIAPNRQEIGLIYKYVCQNNVLLDKVKYHFVNSLGIGKTMASIRILEELGLVIKENENIIGIKTGEKTDLEKSRTFLYLQKGGI